MKYFTRFSLRNPVAVILIAIIVTVAGVVSALGLKEETMPNISIPVISVMTTYPGASPSEVAKQVTSPIEKALNGAKDVQTITSTSLANVSQVELQLNMSADLNTDVQNVQQALNQVTLPTNASKPTVQSFSFSNIPVLAYTVSSKQLSSEQLKNLVNQTIVPAFQGVDGVATVQTAGADADNVVIEFNQKDLAKHNLTTAQVLQDLQADNVSTPMGSTTVGGKVQSVQLNGTLDSLSAIRHLQIPIPANPSAGLNTMEQSIGAIGQSVGQVASGMGQLGQGLGLVQAQTKILSSLQQIQGQIFGVEMSLNQQLAAPKAEQNAQDIAKLQQELVGLKGAQSSLQKQLASLQADAASASSSAPKSPQAALPSVNASGQESKNTKLQTIQLSDIATVTMQPSAATAINRTNGEPSILVSVAKTEDANTVDVAKAVGAKLTSIEKRLPQGIHIDTLFDSSQTIKQSVNGLLREAILGAVFAVLVILLFLRNWLTTLIAVVSIPLSLLIAILILNRIGATLNIMTLGGMAVATGRVVDDSIVVIENIYRGWKSGLGFGKRLVYFGAREVGNAILSSTLATIAVFLPLTLVSGVVGKIFFPFAITVVVSIASSLIVALTVVPVLASLLVVRKRAKGVDYPFADGMADKNGALHPALEEGASQDLNMVDELAATHEPSATWQRRYQGFLSWCLNHKIWVIVVTAVAFVASVAVLPTVGSTFLPNSTQPTVDVNIAMPVGTPLATTNAKAKQVEQQLKKYPSEVQTVNTQVGGSTNGYGLAKTSTASLTVELKPHTDADTFATTVGNATKQFATNGAKITVQSQAVGGGNTSFDVVVTGTDSNQIGQAATAITNKLKHTAGLTNVTNNLTSTQPEISVVPKPKAAAEYGLTAQQISSTVQSYLSQQNIGTVSIDGQAYNLMATVKSSQPLDSLVRIRDIKLPSTTGATVTVGDVATVTTVQTPTSVLHEGGQPYAEITADYTAKNTGKVLKQAMDEIHAMKLPVGVQVSQSVSSQQQTNSFSQLIEAILVAIGVVYIVMLITFGEWSAPFAILFSMPIALIGAFFGTVVARQPISVSSLIGILMLMGIVVTNAIVLVDRVEQQRRRGLTIRAALLEAGTVRLRPILMTAIATICALLPLALGASEGALISQGLAVVVIGGLVTSTILTLFIVPLVYELLHFRIHRREKREASGGLEA